MSPNNFCPIHWSRAIVLIDMNAFFASIEQADFPELRGRPVGVTNGDQGTCIITCSYEARAYGLKTGMRLPEAYRLCPDLIRRPARPQRYSQISKTIMHALHDISPDLEVFSVDEAFLDVTYCQKLYGSPVRIAQLAKAKVLEASGLPCSVGISGDKTTAKFAAKREKPNGFTVIPPWEAKRVLAPMPVTELCGIAHGIANFLAQYGAVTCGDVARLPISVLAKRFGNPGRRMWYMCQGADPDPVHTNVAPPKSMGHGKVMPPRTVDPKLIRTYLLHMSEKLAARLRRHDMLAQHFFIGLRQYKIGWLGAKAKLIRPSNDGQQIYRLGCEVFREHWRGEPVCQIQVTALDPRSDSEQCDLFLPDTDQRVQVNAATDDINQRYGEFTIAPARLLGRSSMPNVIAPAWKPDGHRQSV